MTFSKTRQAQPAATRPDSYPLPKDIFMSEREKLETEIRDAQMDLVAKRAMQPFRAQRGLTHQANGITR